ncbi:hypothetical protein YC2023_068401 [Brassica napus]
MLLELWRNLSQSKSSPIEKTTKCYNPKSAFKIVVRGSGLNKAQYKRPHTQNSSRHSSFEKIKPNGAKKKKVAVSFTSERNPNFTYQPLNWSRNREVDQGRFRIDEEEE